MQVLNPNNVKIYNLTAGKSLPEWISSRKRRALTKKDVEYDKRIELLQDFEMPGVSLTVKLSPDGHYIFASGVYKPRIRCFEVDNLAMKFERCYDDEAVTFEVLSDDYQKLVFLQCNRYVEFHSSGGVYYRLRIPTYGRDLKYHFATCDLYLVGIGPDIYRLNLERGQFLNSLTTEASEVNKVRVNSEHRLVVVGTKEGKVEAWDPRTRNRVGILDVAMQCITPENPHLEDFPSITSLEFKGALTMGVGTATGQVLLYDLRADRPFRIKDHMYGLPIKDLAFQQDKVLSMDQCCVKIWEQDSGKLFTYVEAGTETKFNSLCHYPNSGLIFLANESPKIRSYYIPSLGPAPKWCSFLDNLTEELEETSFETIYDDYKFVTKTELEELGLGHLIGTKMLRGYMHGFFIDYRLYRKAKEASQPFAYEEFKKRKIRETIDEDVKDRIQIKRLPKVNKELALKLMDAQTNDKKKKHRGAAVLLEDERFKDLFENPDFQIDPNAEEYRLLNPVISQLDKARVKQLKQQLEQKFEAVEEEDEGVEGKASSDESEWSTDDEKEWVAEVKRQHKLIKRQKEATEREELLNSAPKPQMYQLKKGEVFSGVKSLKPQTNSNLPLEERIRAESSNTFTELGSGNREMKFTVPKGKKKYTSKTPEEHRASRKHLVRSVPKSFNKKNTFKPWKKFKR